MKDVIAKRERRGLTTDKIFTNDKSLRYPPWLGLSNIFESDTPRLSIPEELFVKWERLRSADNKDFTNPRQHQRGNGVVDQRLVIDR